MCYCCCNNEFNSKKEKNIIQEENKSNIESSMEISGESATKIIIIGDEKDEQTQKIKKHLKDIFFYGYIKIGVYNIIYKNSKINLEVTYIPFSMLNYCSQNKYNYVISLCTKKKEHIEIIKTFNKTKYIMRNICSEFEIFEKCSDIIEDSDFKLVNHFRKEINKIMKVRSNKSLRKCNKCKLFNF